MQLFKSDFDPSTIPDPIAQQTKWEPMVNSWSVFYFFSEHRAKKITNTQMIFERSPFGKLGLWFGLILSLSLIFTSIFSSDSENGKFLISGFFGFLIIFAELFFNHKKIIFDKEKNIFSLKRIYFGLKTYEEKTELNNIHAIQLISRYGPSTGRIFRYEINTVLKNGNRFNICQYKSHDKTIEDTQKISEFLKIPIWNAIGKNINAW